jgi:hypothetical protein
MLAAVGGILTTVKETPTMTMAVMGLILSIGLTGYLTKLVIDSQQQVIQVVKENTESGAVLRATIVAEGKETTQIMVYLKSLDDRLRNKGI